MSKISDPELLKQLDAPEAGDPGRVEGGWKVGDPIDLLQGISQGLIDPVEGIVQLAEKSTGWKIAPQNVRDWARNYRNQARSTMLGVGGEVVGNIAPALVLPGGAMGTAASLGERAIAGAVAGGLQPVSGGGDYWRAKANQAILGGLTGGGLAPLARQAARIAPFLGHTAAHMHFIPGAGVRLGQLAAMPISGAARQVAKLPAGASGAVAGMPYGARPLETPSGRLYVTPNRPQPSSPAAAADNSDVNRSAKGDRLPATPSRRAADREDDQ
jgi:hypothetical protein